MYAIKIMSGENLADSDVGKGFKIILVDASTPFEFGRCPKTGDPYVQIWNKGESVQHPLTGNAYVMNEDGKTIASFLGRRKQVIVTLDKDDPVPERTIDAIQEVFRNYVNKHDVNPSIPKVTYRMDKDGTRLLELDGRCISFITENKVNFNTNDPIVKEKRAKWEALGMNRHQTDLLIYGPTKLAGSAIERDNARRSRMAYLTSQGIPRDVAMEATAYMVSADGPLS